MSGTSSPFRSGARRLGGLVAAMALVAVSLAISACASTGRPTVQSDVVALPTPLRSWAPLTEAILSELREAAATVGHRLDAPRSAYRASEPPLLLQAPRVVLRADLADPDDGYVVVYDAADAAEAADWGRELASYLGSGFGQANFTPDTQFSVAVLDDAVIFTSWSPGRSSDGAAAEAVFDAVATVGLAIEVIK